MTLLNNSFLMKTVYYFPYKYISSLIFPEATFISSNIYFVFPIVPCANDFHLNPDNNRHRSLLRSRKTAGSVIHSSSTQVDDNLRLDLLVGSFRPLILLNRRHRNARWRSDVWLLHNNPQQHDLRVDFLAGNRSSVVCITSCGHYLHVC